MRLAGAGEEVAAVAEIDEKVHPSLVLEPVVERDDVEGRAEREVQVDFVANLSFPHGHGVADGGLPLEARGAGLRYRLERETTPVAFARGEADDAHRAATERLAELERVFRVASKTEAERLVADGGLPLEARGAGLRGGGGADARADARRDRGRGGRARGRWGCAGVSGVCRARTCRLSESTYDKYVIRRAMLTRTRETTTGGRDAGRARAHGRRERRADGDDEVRQNSKARIDMAGPRGDSTPVARPRRIRRSLGVSGEDPKKRGRVSSCVMRFEYQIVVAPRTRDPTPTRPTR